MEVVGAELRPTRRRRWAILEAEVFDSTGKVKAVWFNRAWLADRLVPGARLLLRGKLEKRGFNVAEHEFLDGGSTRAPAGLHTTGVVPVHPASERLRPQRIREWVWQTIPLARHAVEAIPGRMRRELRMAGAADSLRRLAFPADEHAPRPPGSASHSRSSSSTRRPWSRGGAVVSPGAGDGPPPSGDRVRAWLESLPFTLTGDQERAVGEVDADLGRAQPMQRLLMGEVGSGKTVIALYAMLSAIEAGHQAALMAPTETLAEQHFRTLETLLKGECAPAGLLTSATPPARRRELLDSLAAGEPQLLVGTHALIEETVEFWRHSRSPWSTSSIGSASARGRRSTRRGPVCACRTCST